MANIEEELKALEVKEKEIQDRKAKLESEEKDLPVREEKLKALKLEEQRVIDSITKAKADRREEKETFGERLRSENFEKAKNRIVSEFGYKDPDALRVLEETYKKFDSGDVGEDKIYSNLLKAHVSLSPDKYITLEKKQAEAAKAAEAQIARASGSAMNSSSSIPVDQVQLDDLDIEAAKRIGMPIETYKNLKAKGRFE